MKKEYRVRKHREFDRIIHAGAKVKTPHYTIYVEKAEDQAHSRIGLADSKKNGNAVTRVRIKRQVRAMVSRHFDCKPRLNLIIVIRPSYSPEEKVGNEEELAKALAEIKDTAME